MHQEVISDSTAIYPNLFRLGVNIVFHGHQYIIYLIADALQSRTGQVGRRGSAGNPDNSATSPVSDVHAGTREVRRFRLSGHGHSMVITDLPGVGESRDRDAEYEALYRDILPELDLVLWLIKADDRALSVDEYFWRHILHRGHQQVLFVVTQADKTEPCHEWDMAGIQPSPAQAQNIREKTEAVFRLFRPVHPVVAVSARTGWELDTLVSALMTALPDHAASPLMTRLQDELRTESVRAQAREQFTGAVDRIFDTAESVCIASVARTVLRVVRDTVVSVARAVWNWIFF